MACRQTFVREIYELEDDGCGLAHSRSGPIRGNRPMVHEEPGRWPCKAGGRYSGAVQFLYETVHARKSGRWKQVVAIHGGR